MKYKATQVYLDATDHERLTTEARRQGISLAALMRELAAGYLAERAPTYDTKSWDSIVTTDGEPTDIATEKDRYLTEVADALYAKKMGRTAPKRKR